MLKIDTFLKIGHSHEICQDYILSGTDPFPYIILADGCSGAENSDIGARILCHSALRFLKRHQSRMNILTESYIGTSIISDAAKTKAKFYTKMDCLDATLIIAVKISGMYKIYMFGDGVIYWVTPEKYIDYRQVSYKPNAPGYLRYHLDGFQKYKDNHVIQFIKSFNHDQMEPDALKPYYFEIHEGDVKHLTVASDGIESFIYNDQVSFKTLYNELRHVVLNDSPKGSITEMPKIIEDRFTPEKKELDYLEVADAMTNFKNTNGVFLKRRVKKVMKNYLKEGYVNDDDLSIGCFHEEW